MSAERSPGRTRSAVLHGPGDLRIETGPTPTPGPGEVLVEVSHCGICGTDLHLALEGWGRPGSVGGHEWSGRVVALGADVDAVGVGDAVVGGPQPTCGACPGCRSGRPSLCHARGAPGGEEQRGAFADHVVTHEGAVVPVPAGLDLRAAALAEPLAVALHAVTLAEVVPGQRALVSGAGPIGTLVIAALRARGVTDVVVSEPSPVRRALAASLGARALAPEALDVPSIAEPARIVDGAVDVALECSGRPVAVSAALAQVVRGGRVVLVGTGIEPLALDSNRILLNELVLTGAYEYDADGVADALAVLASGAIDVAALVEPDDIALDDVVPALRGLAAGEVAGKVLVRPALAAVR